MDLIITIDVIKPADIIGRIFSFPLIIIYNKTTSTIGYTFVSPLYFSVISVGRECYCQ